MTSKLNLRASRCLLVTVVALSAAAAIAANGMWITQNQESSVKTGMSTADVEQALGRPARVVNYPNTPGPTWIYHVEGATFGRTDFDVSFGGDGRVLNASEQILGNTW